MHETVQVDEFTKTLLQCLKGALPAMKLMYELDRSHPAASWWRYYCKQNSAMCYSCGEVISRGTNYGTHPLTRHMKTKHRDVFIAFRQAQDDELRSAGKKTVRGKKTAFNTKLIEAVKDIPMLYDAKRRAGTTLDDRKHAWKDVIRKLDVDVSTKFAQGRWSQLRNRYVKERKFAMRDNFSYSINWPYFHDLVWLDGFLQDRVLDNGSSDSPDADAELPSTSSTAKPEPVED